MNGRIYYLPNIFERVLFLGVISDHLSCIEVHIYPRIPNSNKNIIEPHEQSAQQKHAIRHHPKFAGNDGDSIVVKFTFVENHFFEEQNGIWSLEKSDRDWLGLVAVERFAVRDGAFVICSI